MNLLLYVDGDQLFGLIVLAAPCIAFFVLMISIFNLLKDIRDLLKQILALLKVPKKKE